MRVKRWIAFPLAMALLLGGLPLPAQKGAAEELPAEPEPAPRVALKELGWTPAEPAVGEEVGFYAVVENQGGAATSAPVEVAFTVDGVSVAQAVYGGAIAPGQSVTVAAEQAWTAAPNEHRVAAKLAGSSAELARMLAMPAAELARGKPATASSEKTGSGRVAANAVDGDAATQWEAAGAPAHLTVDLQAPYVVDKVAVSLGPDWSARTQTLAVEGSLDGTAFMTLAPAQSYRFERTPKNRHEIAFDPAKVRYVRIAGSSNSNAANGIQLTELEVYENPTYPDETGTANLTVAGLTWEPVGPFAGDSVLFNAEIRNAGEKDFAGDLTVRFEVGGQIVAGTAANVSLPRGWRTTVVSAPWVPASAGPHEVKVYAEGFESGARVYPIRIADAETRLPDGWTHTQVGSHALAGSAVYADGTFAAESSGFDIAGSADEFTFVHRKAAGDTAISLRLHPLANAGASAGSGVMLREGAGPGGDFVGVRLLAGGSLRLESRSGEGAAEAVELRSSVAAPVYVKLQRSGDAFSAYASSDGVQWGEPLAVRRQEMDEELEAGMTVASRNRGQLVRAEFDEVSVEQVNLPDLVVAGVAMSPAEPEPGDEVTFVAEVENRGLAATAQAEFTVGFKVDPSVNVALVATGVHSGIVEPGQTVTVTASAPWTAEPGTHAVLAVADIGETVAEGNDLNNETTAYTAVKVRKSEAEKTDFEKRADFILDTFATERPEQTDRTLWVKEAIFYAQARFERGVDVETALDIVDSVNDNPAGASMFFYTANIDTYLRFGHLYPEALREKVKAKLTAIDYSQNGSTENHFIKFRTAGYLVAQTWPDWSRAAATKQFAEQDLRSMMKRFVTYGMKEYDSTTYAALYVECLLMLYEFAQDEEMRQMAKMTLDAMLANIAGEWMNGYWVSSTLRDYNGMSPEIGGAGTIMAWLYFGGERAPSLRVNEFGYPEGMYSVIAASSSYRLPGLLADIAADRSAPYVHKESHDQHPTNKLNPPHGYRKTTYMTETYGVASQFDGAGSLGWSDQMRRWFVRWTSDGPYSTFFMTHPKRGGIESGATPYEQVLQKDGTVVAVYNIPSGDPFKFINGPFPDSLLKIREDPSGWIFAHGGSVLLAVKPLKPYVWTEAFVGSLRVPVLKSDGTKNGVIVETADPSAYGAEEDGALSEAERIDAELDRFAQAVLARTEVDASGLEQANPSLTYTSLAGDTLSLTYNGARTVNGEAVDYTAWPLIDSPFMHQEVGGSLLTIRRGEEAVVYDFENWQTFRPAAGPDLSAAGLTWTPSYPQAGKDIVFGAAVRNDGLSATPGEGFEAIFKANGETVSTVRHPEALAAGQTVTVTSGAWRPAEQGAYEVSVELRAAGWDEAETANNERDARLEVYGPSRLLFSDGFEQDVTTKWDAAGSVGSWSHEADPARNSMVMKGTSTATSGNPVRKAAKASAWADYEQTSRDYRFEFTAKYAGGAANGGAGEQLRALVRFASPQAYYYFDFNDAADQVSFAKYTAETGFVTLHPPVRIAGKLPGFDFRQYNEYAIEAAGDRFSLFINGVPIIEGVADTAVPSGTVGFMNRNSELWIDEASVRTLGDEPGPDDRTTFDFAVEPGSISDGAVTINVEAADADDLYGAALDIAYDKTKLTLTDVRPHPQFGEHAEATYEEFDSFVRATATRTEADGPSGIDGDVPVLQLTFLVAEPDEPFVLTLRSGSEYVNGASERFTVEEDVEASILLIDPDVNGDGEVEIDDLALVARGHGLTATDPGYDAACDLNRDLVIDAADLDFIADRLLES